MPHTIFVAGDAGEDRFVYPDPEGRPSYDRLPAGASFASCVLGCVLDREVSLVQPLTERADALPAGSPGAIDGIEPRDFLLKGLPAKPGSGPGSEPVRIERYVRRPDLHRPRYRLNVPFDCPEHAILVAHQAGSGWKDPLASEAFENLIARIVRNAGDPAGRDDGAPVPWPRILVNLSSHLPAAALPAHRVPGGQPTPKSSGPFQDRLWNTLYRHRRHVGIVTCMSALRAAGAIINRRLSYENTVEDFCAELYRCRRLTLLAQFSHLFVRIGMVGVVHVKHLFDSLAHHRFEAELYFSPYAKDGLHRNEEEEGFTIGRNTLLIAGLLSGYTWQQRPPSAVPPSFDKSYFSRACRRALRAMRQLDDAGYDTRDVSTGEDILIHAMHATSANFRMWENGKKGDDQHDAAGFGWRRIPPHLLAPLAPRAARTSEPWHILDDVLTDAPVHRINVALALVMAGHQRVFNRKWSEAEKSTYDPLDAEIWSLLTRVEHWNPHDRAPDFVSLEHGYLPAMPRRCGDETSPSDPLVVSDDFRKPFWLDVPIMNFRALNLIERDEIESLRSIVNLFRLYQDQVKETAGTAISAPHGKARERLSPLSIAVFGAPGSGKSYAVKQLAKSVARSPGLLIMEYNVAQFSGVASINTVLDDVVARHDEARRENNNEDCVPLVFFDEFDCAFDSVELGWLKYFLAPMQDGKRANGKPLPPSIFVFAGGLHASFRAFDPRTDPAYDNHRESEEYRKRLETFTARKGPDFISRLRGHVDVLPINASAGRPKHFVRRAMLLRSFLESKRLVEGDRARIAPELVYALLTVDRYRHGVRSIQAIVEMCTPIHGEIQIASLPPPAQLDMHVDATEFMIRVHRGRARTQPEWQSENRDHFLPRPHSEPGRSRGTAP